MSKNINNSTKKKDIKNWEELDKTMTFDNGKGFARHNNISDKDGRKTFYT